MSRRELLGSVVIPAHNEAAAIRRCLDALFSGLEPDELDVVVVCNGCSDDTAALAKLSGRRVRVIELPSPSKPAALRAGDAAVRAFPRLYLDADVVLPGSAARKVLDRLQTGAVAARPPVCYHSSRSSAAVRSYYRARSRVPAVLNSLWGAGVYGLSASGRSRFGPFPDVVADDLWVDQQFDRREVEIVDSAPAVVAVPCHSRDLLGTLRRVYRGKTETRRVPAAAARGRKTTALAVRDLGRLAAGGPQPALDVAIYAAFATCARAAVAIAPATEGPWERDNSSRLRAAHE